MIKILSFVSSFLFGKRLISIPYEVIVDYAIARMRILVQSIAIGFTGLSLVLVGFFVSFFNLLSHFDQTGFFSMTAVARGGLLLCGIGFIFILFASLKKRVSLVQPSDVLTQQVHSPLEDAVALLVTDFVKNRQAKNQREGL